MPPMLRSLHFRRIVQRQRFTGSAPRSTSSSTIAKPTHKRKAPSIPNRSRLDESQLHNSKVENSSTSTAATQSLPNGFLHNFFQHPQYRFVRRLVILSPFMLLGLLHSPYEIMTANGQSMSPFLNPNSSEGLPTTDRILVQHWPIAQADRNQKAVKESGLNEEYNTDFQRGQIVIFPTPHRPGKIAVKRIVAIPGDMVQPLPGYVGGDDPVVVPWNHLWVEGDAGRRSESMDSNWYGPISQNLVLGEVKAVLTSWWTWNWIDWRTHTWPARESARVDENAITEATVDPDAINYSSGWRNGSIALILERIRQQPEQVLHTFVNDPKTRQETRRLYNNALYVADVATSDQERILAKSLVEEMEDVYGREALVFGLRIRRQSRDRGELPTAGNPKLEKSVSRDQAASEAEKWLTKQGWTLEKNADGTTKTQLPTQH